MVPIFSTDKAGNITGRKGFLKFQMLAAEVTFSGFKQACPLDTNQLKTLESFGTPSEKEIITDLEANRQVSRINIHGLVVNTGRTITRAESRRGVDQESAFWLKSSNRHTAFVLLSASGLPKVDFIGSCDGFIKFLFGDQVHVSMYIRDTLAPEWNQLFICEMLPEYTSRYPGVTIEVWDHNDITADRPLGKVFLSWDHVKLGGIFRVPIHSTNTDIKITKGILNFRLLNAEPNYSDFQQGIILDSEHLQELTGFGTPNEKEIITNLETSRRVITPRIPGRRLSVTFETESYATQAKAPTQRTEMTRDEPWLFSSTTHTTIALFSASGLPKTDMVGWCDAYVKIIFGDVTIESNFIRNSREPEWNQLFNFELQRNYTAKFPGITFEVFDHNDVLANEFIGRVFVEWSHVKLGGIFKVPIFSINESGYNQSQKGLLNFQVLNAELELPGFKQGFVMSPNHLKDLQGYGSRTEKETVTNLDADRQPSASSMNYTKVKSPQQQLAKRSTNDWEFWLRESTHHSSMIIFSASGLPKVDFIGSCDGYVKIVYGDQTQKTTYIRDSLTPEWNQLFNFEFSQDFITRFPGITLQVHDHNDITDDRFIGQVFVEWHHVRLGGIFRVPIYKASDTGYNQTQKGTLNFQILNSEVTLEGFQQGITLDADYLKELRGYGSASENEVITNLDAERSTNQRKPPSWSYSSESKPSQLKAPVVNYAHESKPTQAKAQAKSFAPEPTAIQAKAQVKSPEILKTRAFWLRESLNHKTLVLFSASGLPKVDFVGSCDAYIKISFGNQDAQSPYVRDNLEPVWNRVYDFNFLKEDMSRFPGITLDVFDHNDFTAHRFIGNVFVEWHHVQLGGIFKVSIVDPDNRSRKGLLNFQILGSEVTLDNFQQGMALDSSQLQELKGYGSSSENEIITDLDVERSRSSKWSYQAEKKVSQVQSFFTGPENLKTQAFWIHESRNHKMLVLFSASGLPKVDFIGSCDAYIKISFGSQDAQCPYVRDNLEPVWNRVYVFNFLKEDLSRFPGITLEVFDHNDFTAHRFIGSVFVEWHHVQLGGIFKVSIVDPENQSRKGFLNFQILGAEVRLDNFQQGMALDSSQLQELKGYGSSSENELITDLDVDRPRSSKWSYQAEKKVSQVQSFFTGPEKTPAFWLRESTSHKTLVLFSASGLPKVDFIGSCDAYIKISFGNQDALAPYVRDNLEPVWNRLYLFNFLKEDMSRFPGITLEVFDHNDITAHRFIGSVFVKWHQVQLGGIFKVSIMDTEKHQSRKGVLHFQILGSEGILDNFQQGMALDSPQLQELKGYGSSTENELVTDLDAERSRSNNWSYQAERKMSQIQSSFMHSEKPKIATQQQPDKPKIPNQHQPAQPLLHSSKRYITLAILSASGLPKMDVLGSCDAYVKIVIGEETSQTAFIRNSIEPVWNQLFCFDLRSGIGSQTAGVEFEVYHHNNMLADEFIGKVLIEWRYLSLGGIFRVPITNENTSKQQVSQGTLNFHMLNAQVTLNEFQQGFHMDQKHLEELYKFSGQHEITDMNASSRRPRSQASIKSKQSAILQHAEGNVAVVMLSATGLPKVDFIGSCDAYVKLVCGSHLEKTTYHRNTLEPIWNQLFCFQFGTEETAREPGLVLEIYDHNDITSDRYIGKVPIKWSHVRLGGTFRVSILGGSNPNNLDGTKKGTIEFLLFDAQVILKGFKQGLEIEEADFNDMMAFASPSEKELVTDLDAQRNAPVNAFQSDQWFQASEDHVIVAVFSASGLPKMDFIGSADPYVKLVVGDHAEQTAIKFFTLTPVWDQLFCFPLNVNISRRTPGIKFEVWDHDNFKYDDFIGKTVLPWSDINGTVQELPLYSGKDADNLNASNLEGSRQGVLKVQAVKCRIISAAFTQGMRIQRDYFQKHLHSFIQSGSSSTAPSKAKGGGRSFWP